MDHCCLDDSGVIRREFKSGRGRLFSRRALERFLELLEESEEIRNRGRRDTEAGPHRPCNSLLEVVVETQDATSQDLAIRSIYRCVICRH